MMSWVDVGHQFRKDEEQQAASSVERAAASYVRYPPGELCTPDTRTNSRALTVGMIMQLSPGSVDVPITDTAPAMHVLLEGIPARQWGSFDRAVRTRH